MSIPKEPRQIMINLMYLVLTAMLALNVSSEILHAFKTINESVLSSNKSISEKNEKIYESFKQQLQQEATRDNIKPFNDKALAVKAETEKMMKYLDDWKEKIITQSGGYEGDPSEKKIKSESDIDASTLLLVEKKGGDEMKKKMEDLRAFLLKQVNPDDPKEFDKNLPLNISEVEKTDNNPQRNWSIGYFQSMPVMAAVTLISKFQNDIKNSEAIVLNQLNKEAGDIKLNFDDIKAIAITPNSYALAGQKIEAQILMAAYNKSVKPEVTRSSGNITKVEDGVAYWETTASGIGKQTVKGTVSIDLGRKKETRAYEFTYMVGSEGASMQLDKMNVFYVGVPNPVTISAAGYSLEDVYIAPIDGGTIEPTNVKGKFEIKVTKTSGPEGINVAIMAKTPGGATKQVGGLPIRVKRIPDPIAKIANKPGGYLPASTMRVQLGLATILENFEFDARYIATEFEVTISKKRDPDLKGPYKNVGPVWSGNPELKRMVEDLKPGDRIFFDNIKAKGPDNSVRSIPGIFFTMT